MKREELTDADERRLVGLIKEAVAGADAGAAPDEAIAKVAAAHKLGAGAVSMLCSAYNTGRQLGQWRQEKNALDKLAGFPLADAAKVMALLYPSAKTVKAAEWAGLRSSEYDRPPDWAPRPALAPQSREKVAAFFAPFKAKKNKGEADLADPPEPELAEPADRMRRAYGKYERAKRAFEEARRLVSAGEDGLKEKVAALAGYFRQAPSARLPFAQVEHAARAYLPQKEAAAELLALAYRQARLREPTAEQVPLWKQAFDTGSAPFTLVSDCLGAACSLVRAQRGMARAAGELVRVKEAHLRPFCDAIRDDGPPGPESLAGGPLAKAAQFGMIASTAAGNALTRAMGMGAAGVVGKDPAQRVEDDWMDLESPQHLNELRKIKAHALLTSLMTDPDDSIGAHDPDKVLQAYNELSETAPRATERAALLRPLLRRHLAGISDPFEANNMLTLEKGVKDMRDSPAPRAADASIL